MFQHSSWNRRQANAPEQRFDIFDVVYHFSEAAELIQDPEQRILVAQLNLKATLKGKNSMGTQLSGRSSPTLPIHLTGKLRVRWVGGPAAYEMARKLAAQGIDMLPADAWTSHHSLTFQLYLGTLLHDTHCSLSTTCSIRNVFML
jgi:hypothetical protein